MRDFIRNDLEHELKLQDMLRKQIKRAHQLGDYGTVEVKDIFSSLTYIYGLLDSLFTDIIYMDR